MALGIVATVIGALLTIVPFTRGAGTQRRDLDAPGVLEADERTSC
ncbi:hypothetical protein BH18ACT2_BH18ACT2_10480 [soil metagenome]